jgi:hypothetical protein
VSRGHEPHPAVPVRRALAAASDVVGTRLRRVETLGGSRRTDVWRATDGTTDVVVKAYRSTDGDTWAREAAALEALAGGPVPRLLGVSDDPRLIVMADLGRHPSLADALMGDDAATASDAVVGWAAGLARLHAAGRDAGPGFGTALARRASGRSGYELPASARTSAATVDELLPGLEQDAPGGLAALAGVTDLVGGAPLVSPGDTCPDNNLRLDGDLVFLDLEWAEVRPAVWDVAYLRVPWPTCWCAWLLPDDVAGAALAAYRRTAEVDERDLAVATAAWCLLSTGMFLRTALGRHRANRDGPRMPGRRTMILHRLAQVAAADDVAGLAGLADAMHARLHARWGDHPTRLAPAFR